VKSEAPERAILRTLLAALEDPTRAATLSAGDPAVIAVARHHRLTPLLSIVCAATLPPALAETFRRDRIVTAARNMILGQAAEECIRALSAAGVPAIVLKGLDYETRLYKTPGARPTADVDLLVPDEKRRDAFAVLDRLGFGPRAAAPGFDEADYHEVAWTRAGVEIDLHMALAPLVRCRIDYRAVWREAEPFRLGTTEVRALVRPHAVIFQALHMAIDHFGVPAIYLIDMARLLASPDTRARAEDLARAWLCRRPLDTALALMGTFLRRPDAPSAPPSTVARRVSRTFGTTAALPRTEQFLRKFAHFDTAGTALRYLLVQSRRNIRERLERRLRGRSARARLSL
jgi:hypothetical protein